MEVPPTMIYIAQFFHEGMSTKVIVSQEFTEFLGVCNEGCKMAPVLFSLYFGAVVND